MARLKVIPNPRPGVLRYARNGRVDQPAWRAHYQIGGKRRTRDFSVNRYGEASAYRRAVRQRLAWARRAERGEWGA